MTTKKLTFDQISLIRQDFEAVFYHLNKAEQAIADGKEEDYKWHLGYLESHLKSANRIVFPVSPELALTQSIHLSDVDEEAQQKFNDILNTVNL